jgi:hypothetical protein
MAKARAPRARYTPEDDVLIKRLYKQGWSSYEMSYRLHQSSGRVATQTAIGQRVAHLLAADQLESRGYGKRSITTEAVGWYNKEFGTEIGPGSMLELSEMKAAKKRNGHKNGKRLTSREVVGFSKLKGTDEPQLTYTVTMLRLHKQQPDILGNFLSLLETAVNEGKTAPDVLDDLRMALA